MSTIEVQYYAVLREQAGVSEERVTTRATTAAALYEELRTRHGLTLGAAQLRVAINGEFADWQAPLADGARVVFIPPVAGG
ncbi:MAG TPA: MoaD/ThiS family protein [Steroidobacteraceae bacterium]|nr:MoaD/ThiS family protein [Steroidobacteraceae bacterium]